MMPPTRYAPRRSLASRAASSDRKNHEQIEAQRDEHADEALLFGEDREDEVVVRHGQELYCPCVPCRKPLPVSPPDPTVTRA